ncbi:MAG: transposase [Spartobacteria bacterium]|nr:transposase [Spartobacteria bacterium]
MRRGRIKREQLAYYHLITRVVLRQMLLGEEEKAVLHRLIRRVEGFTGVNVLTYALMTNHVHILVEEPDRNTEVSDAELLKRLLCLYGRVGRFEILERWALWTERGMLDAVEEDKARYRRRMHDISEFMKQIKQRFVNWYHRKHGTCGTIWQDRFKSVLVEDGAALRTMAAYIEMNPVRAGIVDEPKAYRFCGFGEAMRGTKVARRGIACVAKALAVSGSWDVVSQTYYEHVLMYEEVRNNRNLVYMDQDFLREKMKNRTKLTPLERLLCRCRYFTEGQVLGGKDFVEEFFAEHRDYFGPRRKQGRRKVRDGLGDLFAIRDVHG